MKIMAFGDIHFRSTNPKNRTDNFFETQLGKVEFGLKLYKQKSVDVICFPGDLFHSAQKTPHLVVQKVIELFLRYNPFALSIAGQHDQAYHTPDLENTPIEVMHKAKIITLFQSFVDGRSPHIRINGASFGESIPMPKEEATNILVIHKMIVKNPLWEGQTDYTYTQNLLAKYPYDLIISGDNHTFFTDEYKGRLLVNLGSLMRTNIDQKDHVPSIAIYNTDTKLLDIIEIPVKPFEEVMNLEEAVKEKEKEQRVNAFVEGLKESTEMSLDFVSNLKSFIETNKVNAQVESIINTCLGGNV